MIGAVRLLRLAARCPACGAPPKLRTVPNAAHLLEGADPDSVLLTIECHVRTCGEIYEIRVRHLVDAA